MRRTAPYSWEMSASFCRRSDNPKRCCALLTSSSFFVRFQKLVSSRSSRIFIDRRHGMMAADTVDGVWLHRQLRDYASRSSLFRLEAHVVRRDGRRLLGGSLSDSSSTEENTRTRKIDSQREVASAVQRPAPSRPSLRCPSAPEPPFRDR